MSEQTLKRHIARFKKEAESAKAVAEAVMGAPLRLLATFHAPQDYQRRSSFVAYSFLYYIDFPPTQPVAGTQYFFYIEFALFFPDTNNLDERARRVFVYISRYPYEHLRAIAQTAERDVLVHTYMERMGELLDYERGAIYAKRFLTSMRYTTIENIYDAMEVLSKVDWRAIHSEFEQWLCRMYANEFPQGIVCNFNITYLRGDMSPLAYYGPLDVKEEKMIHGSIVRANPCFRASFTITPAHTRLRDTPFSGYIGLYITYHNQTNIKVKLYWAIHEIGWTHAGGEKQVSNAQELQQAALDMLRETWESQFAGVWQTLLRDAQRKMDELLSVDELLHALIGCFANAIAAWWEKQVNIVAIVPMHCRTTFTCEHQIVGSSEPVDIVKCRGEVKPTIHYSDAYMHFLPEMHFTLLLHYDKQREVCCIQELACWLVINEGADEARTIPVARWDYARQMESAPCMQYGKDAVAIATQFLPELIAKLQQLNYIVMEEGRKINKGVASFVVLQRAEQSPS